MDDLRYSGFPQNSVLHLGINLFAYHIYSGLGWIPIQSVDRLGCHTSTW